MDSAYNYEVSRWVCDPLFKHSKCVEIVNGSCLSSVRSTRLGASFRLWGSRIYYCVLGKAFVQVLWEHLTTQQHEPKALSVITSNLKLHYASHYVSTYQAYYSFQSRYRFNDFITSWSKLWASGKKEVSRNWSHRSTGGYPSFYLTIYLIIFHHVTVKVIFKLLCVKTDTLAWPIRGSMPLLFIQINVRNAEMGQQHRETQRRYMFKSKRFNAGCGRHKTPAQGRAQNSKFIF